MLMKSGVIRNKEEEKSFSCHQFVRVEYLLCDGGEGGFYFFVIQRQYVSVIQVQCDKTRLWCGERR